SPFGAWNNGNFKLSHYLEISTRNPIRANKKWPDSGIDQAINLESNKRQCSFIRLYRKCSDRLSRSIGCDPPRWVSNNDYSIVTPLFHPFSPCYEARSDFCTCLQ
ncbi:MAG: hypothetical protein BECKG1743E_GA0114224_107461, partial [Candidatus Kentron sp. G]